MFLNLEVRSYESEKAHHHHAFTQLVLPVHGRMEIDVEGRGGRIDQATAACVAPGADHAQQAHTDSRFLVLDCAPGKLELPRIERLAKQVYVPIPVTTRRLIEFAELLDSTRLSLAASQLGGLLLSSLGFDDPSGANPLAQMLAQVRATPAAYWSNERMANVAHMSLSQLHQQFRRSFDQSPQAWLTALRLNEARRWLRDTSLPIADIALRAGFSDQASLTRAMQRVNATTPAMYRRSYRQPR
nr:AraC family transcriptional regulator [uncultured Pseudomonas sp.]